MSFDNVQVLVLAGQRAGHPDPLCEAFNVPFKVETPILGRPMLSWVEDSLDKAGLKRPFIISGYAPKNQGWMQAESGNGPADSSLIALSDVEFPCLITTGDHPLLLPEMINEFISLAHKSNADFCVGLAIEEVVSKAHPTTKRTYLRFSDRAVSGCNLFFVRNKKGSAAVEFAIIAPIFLAIMFSMFEVGWFFYTNSVIDASLDRAGRLLRTGQVQQSIASPADQFDLLYDEICDVVATFGACDQTLTLEVRTFTTFADLAAATDPMVCADSPPDDVDNIAFEPGTELSIIRARACLIYKTVNPMIGVNVSDGPSGERHLISTVIFRNEPYEKGS